MRCVLVPTLLGLTAIAAAKPAVNIPPADQKPPVGRVNSPFTFELLPDTYISNATGGITYSASGLPAWLQFSPAQATFYGTPRAQDVGNANISISARDSTGVTTSSVVLVVSKDPAPTVALSFPAQMADPDLRQFASAEVSPKGTGITVPPNWSFSLGWNGNTFSSDKRLFYSARVRGITDLPDWLEFSNTTFTFNGVAPNTPASYPIVVSATDVWGYVGAETSFVLSVGTGEALELGRNLTELNTMAYSNVSYKIDVSRVTIGGSPARTNDFVVQTDLSAAPKWLSFDNQTNTITGTVPADWSNGTVAPFAIPVTLSPTNSSNTLTTSDQLLVNIVPYYFTTDRLPNATTINGTSFAYSIEPYLRNKRVVINASVVPAEASSWLIYYPENYTLVGTPPPNITYNGIDVEFIGTENGVSGGTFMRMDIVGSSVPPPTGEAAPVPEGTLQHAHSDKTKKIIIGVVVGVGGFLILLGLLLWLCCRRRKQSKPAELDGADEKNPYKTPRNSVLRGFPSFDGRRNGRPASIDMNKSPAKSAAGSEVTVAVTPNTIKSKFMASVADSSPRRFGTIKSLFGNVNDAANTKEDLASWSNLQRSVSNTSSFVAEPEPISVTPIVPAPVRVIASTPTTPTAPNIITRSLESGDSLESWESPRSFHWSDEDQYLPPLMPSPSTTVNTHGSPLADEPRARGSPGTFGRADGSPGRPNAETARPLPGFYPPFPRHVGPRDPAPFMSTDNMHNSYSEFSELGHPRSSQSLDDLDSFRDPGSMIATYPSSRSRFSGYQHGNHSASDSSDSGKSFHAPAGLSRFTEFDPSPDPFVSTTQASAAASTATVVPNAAQRDAVEPRTLRNPMYHDISAGPLPVIAGPIMPAGVQPVHRRRASSSRRSTARIHATREHIVGPTSAPVEPEDEQLAVFDTTDDSPNRSTIGRRH